jgi:hypothetical protein
MIEPMSPNHGSYGSGKPDTLYQIFNACGGLYYYQHIK